MKITIKKFEEKEIEIPVYFKPTQLDGHYYMLINDKMLIQVVNYEINESYRSLLLLPSISLVSLDLLSHTLDHGLTHISETEFKHEFVKVNLAIEKMMN